MMTKDEEQQGEEDSAQTQSMDASASVFPELALPTERANSVEKPSP